MRLRRTQNTANQASIYTGRPIARYVYAHNVYAIDIYV